jgi:transcriptional regulator NrdR family protein
MNCPGCRSDKVSTAETRTNKDGSVRRRMRCRDCGAAWSTKTQPTGDVDTNEIRTWQKVPDDVRQEIAAADPDISDNELARIHGISRDTVHRIRAATGVSRESVGRELLHHETMQILAAPLNISNAELGRRYGVSRETIRLVRAKLRHREAPGPVRVMGRSCHGCQHWWANHGRCSFEFPESLAEGPQYAAECDLYAS